MEIAETISDKIATRFFFKKSIPSLLSASDKGRAMLLQFENVRRQEAENKRFQTRQEKIAIAAIFASFLIFALGLIIEFNPGLVSGLAEFLGRWIK